MELRLVGEELRHLLPPRALLRTVAVLLGRLLGLEPGERYQASVLGHPRRAAEPPHGSGGHLGRPPVELRAHLRGVGHAALDHLYEHVGLPCLAPRAIVDRSSRRYSGERALGRLPTGVIPGERRPPRARVLEWGRGPCRARPTLRSRGRRAAVGRASGAREAGGRVAADHLRGRLGGEGAVHADGRGRRTTVDRVPGGGPRGRRTDAPGAADHRGTGVRHPARATGAGLRVGRPTAARPAPRPGARGLDGGRHASGARPRPRPGHAGGVVPGAGRRGPVGPAGRAAPGGRCAVRRAAGRPPGRAGRPGVLDRSRRGR